MRMTSRHTFKCFDRVFQNLKIKNYLDTSGWSVSKKCGFEIILEFLDSIYRLFIKLLVWYHIIDMSDDLFRILSLSNNENHKLLINNVNMNCIKLNIKSLIEIENFLEFIDFCMHFETLRQKKEHKNLVYNGKIWQFLYCRSYGGHMVKCEIFTAELIAAIIQDSNLFHCNLFIAICSDDIKF